MSAVDSAPEVAGVTTGAGLVVEDVWVRYGRSVVAVRGAALRLGPGEALSIVGANGAGKTSLVRAITGLISSQPARITQGSIHYNGHDLAGKQPRKIALAGIAFVPERDKVFPHLSVAEHLALARKHGGAELDVPVPAIFDPVTTRPKTKAAELSGGQKQLLALLCAVLRNPTLLVVDEFSLGLSPAATFEVIEALVWARTNRHMSLLIVEQGIEVVRRVCDRVVVMNGGRTVGEHKLDDVSDQMVSEWYLKAQ